MLFEFPIFGPAAPPFHGRRNQFGSLFWANTWGNKMSNPKRIGLKERPRRTPAARELSQRNSPYNLRVGVFKGCCSQHLSQIGGRIDIVACLISFSRIPRPMGANKIKELCHFYSGSLALASLVPTFPQRSPPSLLTTAACDGLRSTPDCRPRRTFLHLSYSCAPPCGPALLVTQCQKRTLALQQRPRRGGSAAGKADDPCCTGNVIQDMR
jgi:hypothetical protein